MWKAMRCCKYECSGKSEQVSRCTYPECCSAALGDAPEWGWGSEWGNKQGDGHVLVKRKCGKFYRVPIKSAQHSCHCMDKHMKNGQGLWWYKDKFIPAYTDSIIPFCSRAQAQQLCRKQGPCQSWCRHVRPRKPPNTVMPYFMKHQPSLPSNSPIITSTATICSSSALCFHPQWQHKHETSFFSLQPVWKGESTEREQAARGLQTPHVPGRRCVCSVPYLCLWNCSSGASPRNSALLPMLQFKVSAPGILDLQVNMHEC